MTLLKQVMAILGTILTITLIVAIVSPKTAHAVAAAFVQIQPGTTTDLGQNEGQLVSMICKPGVVGCNAIDAQGDISNSVYTVPPGDTLIVTDWEFFATIQPAKPGFFAADYLVSTQSPSVPLTAGFILEDANGSIAGQEHFKAGIRYASGLTVVDYNASASGDGTAFIHGYLVPN